MGASQHKTVIFEEENNGMTSLHIAACHGQDDQVEFLLNTSEELVDVRDDNSWTSLHHAAKNGHFKVAKILLQHNATVSATTVDGNNALHIAALNGHHKIVELLLKKCEELVDVKSGEGCTSLHMAAQNGHLNVAMVLLDHNATVDVTDNDADTPLHMAAWNGRDEIAALLLKRSEEIVHVKNHMGFTSLHIAALNGHLNVVKVLLDHKATVDVADNDAITPLHMAAWNGRDEIAELLLKESERIVDVKNRMGCTSLHIAALNGHLNVVKILLKYNATVMTRSIIGTPPILDAVKNGHFEIVSMLLNCSQLEDKLMKCLVKLSAERNHWRTVKVLLKFGVLGNSVRNSPLGDEHTPSCTNETTFDVDNTPFNKRLYFLLDCLFAKNQGVSARWVWSKLQSEIAKFYQCEDTSSNNYLIYYLSPNQRREAISNMKTSMQTVNACVDDVIKWSVDVIPFILDRLNEMEKQVVADEIIFLLQRHGYLLNEKRELLLQHVETNPLTVNIKPIKGDHIGCKACIYFNMCQSKEQDLFGLKLKELTTFNHKHLLGFKESITDDIYSIVILNSDSNRISLEWKISTISGYLCKDFILTTLKQVVECLAQLHNKNIIHCSIKPSNIFIDESNYVHIGDLSSAIFIAEDLSSASVRNVQEEVVDPVYSAPEIRTRDLSGFVDSASDIWSLGCVLFKMITRENYDDNLTLMKQEEIILEYGDDFIEKIIKLVEQMVVLDPKKRIFADEIVQHPILQNIKLPNERRLCGHDQENLIGQGAHGSVNLLQNKVIKEAHPNKIAQESLEAEKEVRSYIVASGGSEGITASIEKECLNLPYLIMEYCEKGSLKQIISSRQQIPIRSYALQMTTAVCHLHNLNIIHRDIKPANFVVNNQNMVKLIDFGLSRVLSRGEKCTGIVGTDKYMAPEVIANEEYDHSADIYSLGCTIYEMVTLRSVFDDKNKGGLEKLIGFDWIDCMLKDDPKQRKHMLLLTIIVDCMQDLYNEDSIQYFEPVLRSFWTLWKECLTENNSEYIDENSEINFADVMRISNSLVTQLADMMRISNSLVTQLADMMRRDNGFETMFANLMRISNSLVTQLADMMRNDSSTTEFADMMKCLQHKSS